MAGYEIPVSLSLAESYSTPQNQQAGTVFNFASPGASVDFGAQQANPVNPVTATSATAQGSGARASAESDLGDVVGGGGAMTGPDWTKIAMVAGVVLLLAIVAYRKL